MKKRLGLMAIVLLALGVTACQTGNSSSSSVAVDGAVAKLQQAYDSLGALIPDPSNITAGFEVPVTLANSVTAEWSSDEPGVISFGTPANGFAVATVNRPAVDAGDAHVTISALLSLQSELSSEMLHQTWDMELTVKQNTLELAVDNVEDILAITDKKYDGKITVTLDDMTIFAKSVGEAWAYDGTGIIQIYGGAASTVVVGKVYTIFGIITWYYGIWEITKSTATEQTSSVANNPNKEVITSINEKITALTTAGEHLSALGDASSGNFEPIFARITGKVYMLPNDTSNYNTWIMDTTATSYVAGIAKTDTVAETPSNSLMVYYGTNDFNRVRQYNGIVVTMDVVIYTYRSNNHAFAIYYVGGPEGIEATLTDAQKQTIDANTLAFPSYLETATTLTLPATGVNGSAIAWSSNNETVINSTTGVVTPPTTGNVTVTLEATVTLGALAPIKKTFGILVGALDVTTMATFATKAKGDILYSEVEVLWANSNKKAYIVGDSTGYGYVYNSSELSMKVGDFVGMVYTVDIYGGLYEIINVTVRVAKGTDPNLVPTATAWTSVEALAFDSVTNFSPVYVSMEVVGYTEGSNVNAYLPGYGPRYVQTNGAASTLAGKKFTATGWIIGRSTSKITLQGTYTNPVDATDAEKLAVSVGLFKAPAANAAVTANLTLPTAVKFGSLAWTSSNEAVISNTGVVTRPAAGQPDATVTLSYVITVGTESTTPVEIEYTVKAEEPVVAPVLFEQNWNSLAVTSSYLASPGSGDTYLTGWSFGEVWNNVDAKDGAGKAGETVGSSGVLRMRTSKTTYGNTAFFYNTAAFSADITKIEFNAKYYNQYSDVKLEVFVSANGTDWQLVTLVALPTAAATFDNWGSFSYNVSVAGARYVKFLATGLNSYNNSVNIDDLVVRG